MSAVDLEWALDTLNSRRYLRDGVAAADVNGIVAKAIPQLKRGARALELLCDLKRVCSGASTFSEQRAVWHEVDAFLAELTPGTVQTPGKAEVTP